MQTTPLGAIGSIHRYPVKSMLGESLARADVAERGLAGDRTHALLDMQSGKVASAKKPWMWRELLKCSATGLPSSNEHKVEIRLPNGKSVRDGDAAVDRGRRHRIFAL